MRISVLGTGYLGATHAAALASCGHEVLGIDADAARVEQLRLGVAPFHEPRLDELLARGVRSGALCFDTDYGRAARFADVHFLCVGTPQRPGSHAADLSAMWSAVHRLAPLLERGCLVVGKSTVPVGTASQVRDALRDNAPAGRSVELAWNPEFLREGHAVEDSLGPDRLVFGVASDPAYETLCAVYAPILASGVPAVRTDLPTAELAKVSANVMLAARISLVNLLAEVCEVTDADVGDLIEILGYDGRIGNRFLTPGIGFGGGCLPKDTRAFVARAEELGLGDAAAVLREVDVLNMRQRARTVDLAVSLLGGRARDEEVAVLGAAFKAGSDDVRDSPALDVACTLAGRGARVRVYDPKAGGNARRAAPGLTVVDTVEDACRGAALTLVLTDWAEFRSIDPVSLADVVRRPVVLDGRLSLDPDKWRAAGWDFHGLGRRVG
ncbi:MAG TPA: UDP-glucose/GDP-mannose dehydrogenase family protein [Intrasporangium sp.]|uniref:UDP-glucose dehydrogenase family protein n=1 Tax=Intrasporangium sp. TaxID=1925024 RepID=UPI002D769AC6|nr:UDP-glucose/GDP-mannose dehydrogenase family protein [Intrasporangium sp.]HET7399676.1 UDP-glucose/GDP-mannose dehydrogenase family protein [Intrasporangium sp.]